MAQQFINDIADFVPPEVGFGTDEKTPEDAYSDIKHGKLTLPVIFTLYCGTKEENELVIKALQNEVTDKEFVEVTRTLVKNGSIAFAQKRARQFVSSAKSYLSVFPKEKRWPFEEMCFVAYSNRYYKALRKFKD